MDEKKKSTIYLHMLSRYKDLINEKETKTITEIRLLVAPYNPFVDQQKKKMLPSDYTYSEDFMPAVDRALEYLRKIESCEFAFNFWMTFEEMNEVSAADPANKAILFASILRSFGSDTVRVIITKTGAYYVTFSYDGKNYLYAPKTDSLLANEDVTKLISEDPIRHSFNDIHYENFEE